MFEGLCAIQCTKEEICGAFSITDKTLEAWCRRTYDAGFSEVFREKRGKGKISLRRSQFRLAEKNANMAIWLGKQYLGQRDKFEEDTQADMAKILQNIRSMAELVNTPAEDRNIEDFE